MFADWSTLMNEECEIEEYTEGPPVCHTPVGIRKGCAVRPRTDGTDPNRRSPFGQGTPRAALTRTRKRDHSHKELLI